MIVCKGCGHRNPAGEEFCASCGRFLEWSGERIEVPAPPEPEPEPEPAPAPAPVRPGVVTRVRTALHPRAAGTPGGDPSAVQPQRREVPVPDRPPAAADERPAASPAAGEPPAALTADTVLLSTTTPRALATPAEAEAGAMGLVGGDPSLPAPRSVETEEADVPAGADPTGTTDLAGTTGFAEPTGGEGAGSLALVANTLRRPGEPATGGGADTEQAVDGVGPGGATGGESGTGARGQVLRQPTEVERAADNRRRTQPVVSQPEEPEVPSPGDVFCGTCGQFNPPSRNFCRRCGAGLADAPTYDGMGFFRRHFLGQPRIWRAGDRPGKLGKQLSASKTAWRAWSGVMRVFGVIFLFAFMVFLFIPSSWSNPERSWIDRQYQSVIRRVFVQYTPVNPIGATATDFDGAHPPQLAIDAATNTWWQTSAPNDGIGQKITTTFTSHTNIDKVSIAPGAESSQQDYLSEARPKDIELTFSNGYHIHETLQDKNGFQQLAVSARNVTSMTLTILSVYPSPTGHATAISELQFSVRT